VGSHVGIVRFGLYWSQAIASNDMSKVKHLVAMIGERQVPRDSWYDAKQNYFKGALSSIRAKAPAFEVTLSQRGQ